LGGKLVDDSIRGTRRYTTVKDRAVCGLRFVMPVGRAELRSLAWRHLAVMNRDTRESVKPMDLLISARGNAGGAVVSA
jgi:hypothetical protein